MLVSYFVYVSYREKCGTSNIQAASGGNDDNVELNESYNTDNSDNDDDEVRMIIDQSDDRDGTSGVVNSLSLSRTTLHSDFDQSIGVSIFVYTDRGM